MSENEYGTLMKWFWQGSTEVMGEKPVKCHFARYVQYVTCIIKLGWWNCAV